MARKAAPRLTPEQQAARKKRVLLLGCGGALAVVLIVLISIYAALHSGPALPRSVQKRAAQEGTAPAATSALPQGTPGLQQQMAQLQYAAQTGDTRPQKLYVSDSELNAMIAEGFKADEHLKQVRAYFGRGKAYIVGVVQWHGQTLNLTVTAAPVIVNGGVRFGVESVNVGSMAAPAAVAQRVQQAANKDQDRLSPTRTGIYVDSIDIQDGVAILSGRAVAKTQ